MSKTTRWSRLALVLGLSLLLPIGATAQTETSDGDVPVPELDGLAWYRSFDLAGPEMETTLPEGEVADWATLLDGAGATFDDLEYTYQAAFDPEALPDLGGMATVRVVGAETETLRALVVEDIVAQVTRAGFEPPTIGPSTIAGKEVMVVEMPEGVGLEDAVVYANGDVAWAFVMDPELTAVGLERLP